MDPTGKLIQKSVQARTLTISDKAYLKFNLSKGKHVH